jgi:hypothetical protein
MWKKQKWRRYHILVPVAFPSKYSDAECIKAVFRETHNFVVNSLLEARCKAVFEPTEAYIDQSAIEGQMV